MDKQAASAMVLVHGAWHGAWCYERLIPELAAQGVWSLARDLPGHGLNALFPASYTVRPLDRAAFASERSPAAAITLDDYADSVIQTIHQLAALGFAQVSLVGHSMGGIVLGAVGERVPEKIARLIYLAAFMPASGVPAVAYIGAAENAGERVGPQFMADPQQVGALRIDQHSGDAAYRAGTRAAFFGDIDEVGSAAAAALLSPDVPAQPMAMPTALSRNRWGALPRHYIRCRQDMALRPRLQQRFIAEADAFTPANPTVVHELDSSHSPFLSQPAALASMLAGIVRG